MCGFDDVFDDALDFMIFEEVMKEKKDKDDWLDGLDDDEDDW